MCTEAASPAGAVSYLLAKEWFSRHGSTNGGEADALRMCLLVAVVVLMVLLLDGEERAGRLE